MCAARSRNCATGVASPLRVALALAAAAGCTAADFPTPPRDAPVLRIGSPARILSISPGESWDYYHAQVANFVFEGLTRHAADNRLAPGLAREWHAAADGREYRFILRTGVTFHDGTPFTAHDVVRAWTAELVAPEDVVSHPWMLDPIEGAFDVSAGRRPDVTGLSVVDDTTLVIRLREPHAFFPTLLCLPQAAIAGAASTREAPIGTGPWRWVSADSSAVQLARFDGYWAEPAHLDSIVYRHVPDSLAIAAFEAGWVDMIAELPIEARLEWSGRSDIGFVESDAMAVTRLVINMREPAFRDRRVRQALNHAVGAARLAQAIAAPTAIRSAGSIPPGITGSNRRREPYAFDPVLARRLLQAGGYPLDRPLRLWVPPPGLADYPAQIGTLLRDYFEAIGLTVELRVQRGGSEQAMAERRVDLALTVWVGDYADGDAFLYPLYHSNVAGSAGNEGAYSNPALDSLIDASRRELDPARRIELLRAADGLVFEDAPVVWLWFTRAATAYSLRLAGWTGDPQRARFTTLRVAGAPGSRRP